MSLDPDRALGLDPTERIMLTGPEATIDWARSIPDFGWYAEVYALFLGDGHVLLRAAWLGSATTLDDFATWPDFALGYTPAAGAAALRACAAGLSVVVCDKAVFPRDKTCGDGLTASALRLLERLGLESNRIGGWTRVGEVVVRSPSGRTVELPLPGDGLFAAVAPRLALDHALLELAARRGAEVRPGAA